MWMLYAKEKTDKRFYPMDYNAGHKVINKIFATMFNDKEAEKLRTELQSLHDLNDGWLFELRRCG